MEAESSDGRRVEDPEHSETAQSSSTLVEGTVIDESSHGSTKDDAAIAYRLQQEEVARASSSDSRRGVDTGPTVVGRPVSDGYYRRYEYADDEESRPITRGDLNDRELFVLEVYSLGKGVTCLAVLDVVFLLFLSILDIYYLLLFWGPICGLVGASTYEACYMYFYVVYYILRVAGDILMTVRGNWWSIISLIFTVIILTFIIQFITYLADLNKNEKELLKNPGALLNRRPRRYVYYY